MLRSLALTYLGITLAGCQFDGSNFSDFAPGLSSDGGPSAPSTVDASAVVNADAQDESTYTAYWSFDTDGSDATGAHHGTLVGTAAITSGSQGFGGGEALELLGNGARVDVANPQSLDFNNDFTWHAYVKTTDASGAIFSRNPSGTQWNQGSKALFVRSREVEWDTGWVGNPDTSTQIGDGQWHQLIVTYVAATDALEIYVDPGVDDASGVFSNNHNVNRYDEHSHNHLAGLAESGFSIGQGNISGGLPDLNTLEGLIDEAAVFDRALVGDELKLLITNGPSGL